MSAVTSFASLNELATKLRKELEAKKYILLYAFNGTGKTRLSMAFKELGKQEGEEGAKTRDTLYFNAYTEDLFTWDNDLENNQERVLKLNSDSHFFDSLVKKGLDMESLIRPLLRRYADFDFKIDYEQWTVSFSRIVDGETVESIKVSRGEENIFIWCFFFAIVQLAMDGAEAYQWVKYIYLDDPISSLDEHNAIAVGNHLAQLLKKEGHQIKTVISTHHALFFNVLANELGKATKFFLHLERESKTYSLNTIQGDTPFFHHLALLQELWQVKGLGQICTYHFNALRSLLEKASSFHGYKNFSDFLKLDDDPEETLKKRIVAILSHGNYSFYDPVEMLPENKAHFEKILNDFLKFYPFNSELTPEPQDQEAST